LVQKRKGFTGNRSAYQLLPKGAKLAGVSKGRAEPLGSGAVPFHLAVLAFCFLSGHSRTRLEQRELQTLFGSAPQGRCHCLERGVKATCVYHVYVPGPTVDQRLVVENTRSQVEKALDQRELAQWMKYRLYRLAVLVDNEARAEGIWRMMDEAVLGRGGTLKESAKITVEPVPGLDSLEEALRGLA
jgi:hypothetical protein